MMKISVIIPAYNAEQYIVDVLEKIKSITSSEILVIDDGSTDKTAEIVKSLNIRVLSHLANRGKGEALKSGFAEAIRSGIDAVITLDADGQHDPSYIPDLIQAVQKKSYDIIIGSRMNDLKKMPFHRRLSNLITSWLISLRIGQRVEDSQSGFRIIKINVLKNIFLKTHHFETESEILIRSGLKGFKIGHIPIHAIYAGESTSIKVITDTLRFIKLYISSLTW